VAYLRVECGICGAYWNYYEETLHYPPLLTTQVDIQGCVCPRCGNIGFIPGGVSNKANESGVNVNHRKDWRQ